MQGQDHRCQAVDKDIINMVAGYWFHKMLPGDTESQTSALEAGRLVFDGMNEDEMDAAPSFWFYIAIDFMLGALAIITVDPLSDPTPALGKLVESTRQEIRDSQCNVIKRRPLAPSDYERLRSLENRFDD